MSNITKIDDNALAALDALGFDDSAAAGAASFTQIIAKNGKFRETGDDGDTYNEIEGFIVGFRKSTSLWLQSEGGKPAMSSYDGETWDQWDAEQLKDLDDEDAHTVPVAESKYTQWGSDPKGGKGKWAKDRVYIYLLADDQAVPYELSVPATSIKNYSNYKTKLSKAGKSAVKVKTKCVVGEGKRGSDIYDTWEFEQCGGIEDKPTLERVIAAVQATKETLDGFKKSNIERQKSEEVPF